MAALLPVKNEPLAQVNDATVNLFIGSLVRAPSVIVCFAVVLAFRLC